MYLPTIVTINIITVVARIMLETAERECLDQYPMTNPMRDMLAHIADSILLIFSDHPMELMQWVDFTFIPAIYMSANTKRVGCKKDAA